MRFHVGIIGDRYQKAYYRSEFPVMVIKPNFSSVLNCHRRHYKKTVAESCDNKLYVLRNKNKYLEFKPSLSLNSSRTDHKYMGFGSVDSIYLVAGRI